MNTEGGRLAYLGVLRFCGADAITFLQGQLSNDMQQLHDGGCVLAACSNAQGRVLALLRLFMDPSGVLAVLPRDLVGATLAHLQKYVLRSKLRMDDASEALAIGGCLGPEALRRAGLEIPATGKVVHCVQMSVASVPGDPQRFWVVAPSATLSLKLGWEEGSSDEFERIWRWQDVQAGLPQVYPATREAFVAQMLNLDLLDGISFSKGCYTGQEIIARTQNLGRIKRRLSSLELNPGKFAVGDAITLPDGRSGRLTEVVEWNGRIRALAVLSLDAASTPGNA